VDYRPYPASPFLYLAAALVAEALLSRRSLRLAVVVGAVVYFGLASVYLNRAWRTGESLWTHSVRHGGNATAHHSLAMCLVNRRDPRVRRHLEEALRLSPDYVMAHVNLGLLLVELGEVEEGLRHCARASRIAPDWAQPHFWTAQAYDNLGWKDQAARAAHRAAELDPRNLEYLLQAAHYAQKRSDFTRSLEHLDAIEAQQAGYGNNRYFAAFAHQMRGDVEGAKQALRRYLADYPTYAPAQFNLGYTLMEEGDCAAAIPHFEATLRARPDYPEAQTHLADCYARAARVGDRALGGRAAP
jgi:tetratricopeptide (TPR) repeat protein